MNKSIESLIEKKVKAILMKDSLSDEDIKFLIFYKSSQKASPLEKLVSEIKKVMEMINDDE